MSWETVAPASSTSSQTQTSLSAAAQASCLRQQSEHHEAQAEIVRLGERVQSRQRIGEAKQADGAGEKKERARRDGDNRHDVERQAHPPSVDSAPSASRRGGSLLDERNGGEGGEERERQRDVDRRGHAGHRAEQQQRRDAAGSDQLRRHHAVGVARTAQDADQPQRQHRQDEAEGSRQELSHRPSARDSAASSAANCDTTGWLDIEAVVDELSVSRLRPAPCRAAGS